MRENLRRGARVLLPDEAAAILNGRERARQLVRRGNEVGLAIRKDQLEPAAPYRQHSSSTS